MMSLERGEEYKQNHPSPRRQTRTDRKSLQEEETDYAQSLKSMLEQRSTTKQGPSKAKRDLQQNYNVWGWPQWTQYTKDGKRPFNRKSKPIFCAPCNVIIAHDGVFKTHVNGKTHLSEAKREYDRIVGTNTRPVRNAFKRPRNRTMTMTYNNNQDMITNKKATQQKIDF